MIGRTVGVGGVWRRRLSVLGFALSGAVNKILIGSFKYSFSLTARKVGIMSDFSVTKKFRWKNQGGIKLERS